MGKVEETEETVRSHRVSVEVGPEKQNQWEVYIKGLTARNWLHDCRGGRAGGRAGGLAGWLAGQV